MQKYVEKDGRLYYIGNTDGSPEGLLKLIIGTNKNRMWVNGKYIRTRPPFAQARTLQEL
jgi:hypothetical protein